MLVDSHRRSGLRKETGHFRQPRTRRVPQSNVLGDLAFLPSREIANLRVFSGLLGFESRALGGLREQAQAPASNPKGWSCYILECADHSYYPGVATDVFDRVHEHNSGQGAKYTRGRRPVRLA